LTSRLLGVEALSIWQKRIIGVERRRHLFGLSALFNVSM
jgi:hypothetical protein